MNPTLAVAWAWAQDIEDPKTREVLLVLARNNCDCALSQIAGGACVPPADVEAHVRDLVEAGLLLLAGDRLALNFDAEMAARHLRRNRRALGPVAAAPQVEEAPAENARQRAPEPAPRAARAKGDRPAFVPSNAVFAAAGSPEKRAWDRTRPGRGFPDCATGPDGKTKGWWFETRWPAGADEGRAA